MRQPSGLVWVRNLQYVQLHRYCHALQFIHMKQLNMAIELRVHVSYSRE